MKTRTHWLAVLLSFVAAMPALAQTHRVDDGQTQVLGPALRLKPISPYSRGTQANIVAGDVTVVVRLDVAEWKGRKGRIYMTLPGQSGGTITATWTTRGRLMPGVLRTGERTPVYAGPIQGEVIEDTLRMEIRADERRLPRNPQLAFAFEIDLDTP
jgi:hypothetical protein